MALALVASAPQYSTPVSLFRPSFTMFTPDKSSMSNGRGRAKSSSSTVSSPASLSPLQSPSRRAAHILHPQPLGFPTPSLLPNREKQKEDFFVDSTRLATLIRRLDSDKANDGQHDETENLQEDVWLDLYKILFTIRAAFRNSPSVAGDEATQHWSRHTHLFERLAKIKLFEDTQRQHDARTLSPLTYYAQKSIPATVRDMAISLAYLCGKDGPARAQLHQHVH
ncbi:hypothetical protein BU17DRAFT_63099 [Hysterangium stoloniferum]|nr:hypothetical protein BU17DRAFT_63099 [Hysterangium stoloniferum]